MNDLLVKDLINLPNTYMGEAPPGEDVCQWVALSSGTSKTFFGLKTINSPECVVYVRNPSNQAAKNTVHACLETLQNWNDEHHALIVTRLPSYVGRDEKHRSVYSFRIQFIIGG